MSSVCKKINLRCEYPVGLKLDWIFLYQVYGNQKSWHPIFANTPFLKLKPRLMIPRAFINRIVILSFMALVGFSIAKAIQSQSVIGIILAVVSLGAGIYFLYLLAKANQDQEQEEAA